MIIIPLNQEIKVRAKNYVFPCCCRRFPEYCVKYHVICPLGGELAIIDVEIKSVGK